MIVDVDKRLKKQGSEVGEEILFYTCMIVLLTLLVNGNTTGFVINLLGLSNENLVSMNVMATRLEDHNNMTKEFYHRF